MSGLPYLELPSVDAPRYAVRLDEGNLGGRALQTESTHFDVRESAEPMRTGACGCVLGRF